jgi:hypothetical protein
MIEKPSDQHDFDAIRKAGERTAAFIKNNLKPGDPLRGPLIAVVVVLVVASFVSLVYAILRNRLFDVLFIIVLVALLGLALALIWVAAYPGQAPGQRRGAQRVLLAAIAVILVTSWSIDTGSMGIARQARFAFHYFRLDLGAARFEDFIDGTTSNDSDVESLDTFEINQRDNEPIIPGIGSGGSVTNQRDLLKALTMYGTLKITGKARVTRPWQTGTILLGAHTLELDGAEIEIGRYNLVIVANNITVHSGATIRAFAPRPGGEPAPTHPNGTGIEGLNAGDVHLAVLGSVSGKINVDLRGEDGGPGSPGQNGRDVPPDQVPKTLESDGVGIIRPISQKELEAIRDTYKDPSPQVRQQQNEVISECGSHCLINECTHTASAGTKGIDADATDLLVERGNGKSGGKGGDGGHLYVYTRPGHSGNVRDGIVLEGTAHSKGGHGGLPGRPGRGGPGGKRLPTGPQDPFRICAKGSDGPSGADGRASSTGQEGTDGQTSVGPIPHEIDLTTFFGGQLL